MRAAATLGSLAAVLASLASACGAPPRENACADPCACADSGPPDFAREGSGAPSPTSTSTQKAALVRVNHWRTAIGLSPYDAAAGLEKSATAHATFVSTTPESCWPNFHDEVASCAGFTGADPGARMDAAGYDSSAGWSEDLAFEPVPIDAVDTWLWTVYHRVPLLSRDFHQLGFGSAGSIEVMDFGVVGSGAGAADPSVFPPPGATDVPLSFAGNLEGPTPPTPPGGWPSGPVVSVHFPASGAVVDSFELFDGGCHLVPATRTGEQTDPALASTGVAAVYANKPLSPGIRYVASISATVYGQEWSKSWVFTAR